ncbi:hypothetical protein C8R47DRAFT_1056657 [Mycena vitilis]|nr:hypothetical protein C8R47DRAFT_1056657 [Mycena vitilis]
MASTTELPNAFTPLAFLPRPLSNQFEVSRYLYAITLGVYIWDIGLNLGNDYKLLFRHRIRFPTNIYFLSRIFTLGYILTSFVEAVAPVKDCNALQLGIGITMLLSQASTAMLFLLRVIGVWYPSKIVSAVFIFLWLLLVGADITVPVGIRAAHIGTTLQCMSTTVPENTESVAIMGLINDTAIFFAVNYRILAHMVVAKSLKARIDVFLGGGQLPRLSRALIQGGQHFYLIAVCTHIIHLTFLKLPNLPAVYHAMLTVPGLTLINTMACVVFRKIKFGLISSDGTTNVMATAPDFRPATRTSPSLPLHNSRGTPGAAAFGLNGSFPLEVRVEKTDKIESSVDD